MSSVHDEFTPLDPDEPKLCGQLECECCQHASILYERIAELEAALRAIANYPSIVPSEEHYRLTGVPRYPDFREIARDALNSK